MKLVVGLGNPGPKYAGNRHNVGFQLLDLLVTINPASGWSAKFDGAVSEVMLAEKTLLLKPMTFMNRSGQAVRKAIDFYKIELPDVLIVCDDLDLNLGAIRIKAKGSSGGQNGLKDIFAHLQTEEVARMRLGVGRRGNQDAADYVLTDFRASETPVVTEMLQLGCAAVETWVRSGLATAMNQFNRNEAKAGET